MPLRRNATTRPVLDVETPYIFSRVDALLGAQLASFDGLLAKIKKTLRPTIVPDLRLGDAVLFDYRVLHRGTRNTSGGPRPVFVMTLAKPWFRDLLNFPRRALFPGEHLAEDDLKAAQDDPSDSDPTPAAT